MNSPHTTYMQVLEAQSGLANNSHDSALLYLPGQEKPIGSISFPKGIKLSAIRLCVDGEMYDSPRFSDGAFHFERKDG